MMVIISSLGQDGVAARHGDSGAKGEKGMPGQRGDRGAKGFVGEEGDSGEIGPKGNAGFPGRDGRDGDYGDRGVKGPAGEKVKQSKKRICDLAILFRAKLDEKVRKDTQETTELTAKPDQTVCKEKLAEMGYQGSIIRRPSSLHNLHTSTSKLQKLIL